MFEFAAAVSPVLRVHVIPGEAPHDGALMLAAATEPGPEMIRLLDLVDPAMLDDVDRVTYLQTWERASRWVAAQHSGAVVAVAGRTPRGRDDFPREHVRVALAGIGGSPKACVDTARALAGPLAPARHALARGEISEAHTRVLAQETAGLPAGTATSVATAVLDKAPGRTPSQFRRAVRRAVLTAGPAAAETAEAHAATRRHVARHVEPDGQASLTVHGPAVDVLTIWTALDLTASLKAADDPRTLDQRRFDALVTLARGTTGCPGHSTPSPTSASTAGDPSQVTSGGTTGSDGSGASHCPGAVGPGSASPTGRRRGLEPTVYLYADAATWAGLADAPVELDGYGPIPAGAARAHFASSTWRAVVTDALTQRPLAVSDTTYRPSARTRRLLHLRDRTCTGIACTAPVWHCDADHSQPHHQGGCTDPHNCGLTCRRDHRMKTFTDWTWHREPDDTITWTAPTGHTYTRHPDRYPMPPKNDNGSDGANRERGSAGQPPPGPEDDPPF